MSSGKEPRDTDYGTSTDLAVADVVTPTHHAPESKNVDELLTEMRENGMHVVIVIDEFGATEGLITMEDALETAGPVGGDLPADGAGTD